MGQNFGHLANFEGLFIGQIASGKVTLMPLSGGNVTYSKTTLSIPQPVISALDQPSDDGVSLSNDKTSDGGDDMEKRLAVLETEVAHIKTDVSDLKKSVSSIESTVNSIDKNMAVIMVKLDNITDSLSKKPSSDAVDKKISEAKLSQIVWTIGSVLAIVSLASGIIIKTLHV